MVATGAPASSAAPRFGLLLFLVCLLAFALRELFVLSAVVEFPIRGDTRDYFAYAWNLVEHGIYSNAFPPAPPVPDGYRLPGYSWLVAIGMWLWPQGTQTELAGWYPFVLQAQVVLGTATVALTGWIGRHWMQPAWALLAAVLLAIWPHHVAATGALLSEVVFGFALTLGLACFAHAWSKRGIAWFVATGLAFGYAYLVNPIVLLFPPLLAVMVWRLKAPRAAGWLLVAFLVPVFAFALRGATIDDTGAQGSAQRATTNFVQGSWPQYHAAANLFRSGDPVAKAIIDEIDAETRELGSDPRKGLARIGDRMAYDRAGYARWYLLSKPWLLWDWPIQIGSDDLYVVEVQRSPLERLPVLRALVGGVRAINPLLTALLLVGAFGLAVFGWRNARWVPAAATGSLALYFTAMHVLLQAEPRYAIPYRGIEALVIASLLSFAIGWLRPDRLSPDER
jgi:hypothetical protein